MSEPIPGGNTKPPPPEAQAELLLVAALDKAMANTEVTEVVDVDSVMTVDEALDITDRIRARLDDIRELIAQAYIGRAWIVLGYQSWDAYCVCEFASQLSGYPLKERLAMVNWLRQAAGMSTRALASAFGVSQSTIRNDLQVSRNYSPDTGTAISATITGLDGKDYPVTLKRKPRDKRREELEDIASTAVRLSNTTRMLQKRIEAWERRWVYTDHPYEREQISCTGDTIASVGDQLPLILKLLAEMRSATTVVDT
jgi:transcriptional regulator with XRE-family HTH domain